ncbi:MAG TPA: TetR-like C-terminal domain-containing protein [Stenotrophomonas sp.]|nr:TetR-like C-terminal domain-containing protein [Stenotrophomonas sp.]
MENQPLEGAAPGGEVRRRTGGRSARVREAVMQAAADALGELGPAGLSFSELARRSGVHATSIQRRWGSIENVILEALLDASQVRIAIPDSGELRRDLCGVARSLAGYLSSPLGEGIVRMMAASKDDYALAQSRAAFYKVRFNAAEVIIERAIARGELPQGTDAKLLLEMLSGPIYFRVLMTREVVDEGFIEKVVGVLLDGVRSGQRGATGVA